jgi:hypothetical protein
MAKPQQETIPGTQADRNKAIDKLVAEVDELTQQWKSIGDEMTAKRDALLEEMQKHGLETYRCLATEPPTTVSVKGGKVKVALKRDRAETEIEA